jgi:hypothetical protein
MAQPQVGATTVIGGFGNNVVAYGYAMTGTAITSCAAATVVTTTIYKSNVFYGAQYNSISGIYSPAAGAAEVKQAINLFGKVGPGHAYYAKAVAASTWTTITSSAWTTNAAQNAYWDF